MKILRVKESEDKFKLIKIRKYQKLKILKIKQFEN